MSRFKNLLLAAVLASTALVATPQTAMAAVDVTAVETAIAGASAPIALIGGAVLLVLVGIAVYRWIRKAM